MAGRLTILSCRILAIAAAWALAFHLFWKFPLFGGPIWLVSLGGFSTLLVLRVRLSDIAGIIVVVTIMLLVSGLAATVMMPGVSLGHERPEQTAADAFWAPLCCLAIGGFAGLLVRDLDRPGGKVFWWIVAIGGALVAMAALTPQLIVVLHK